MARPFPSVQCIMNDNDQIFHQSLSSDLLEMSFDPPFEDEDISSSSQSFNPAQNILWVS